MPDEQKKPRGVTLRAVLIGLAFIPINVYLVVQWETVWDIQDPTTLTIAFNAIFCLFLVIALNLPLRRLLPSVALHQGELLTIYSMLMVAVPVSGHDFTHSIMGTLGNARWFATPENEWADLFWGYVPQWLEPRADVLDGYYTGQSSFYTTRHIQGWLQPMLWWTLYLTVSSFVMICIDTIMRKQWIQREKLTYPLVHLPFEMTRTDSAESFFRNRLFWLGFGAAAGICLYNGFSVLFPAIPIIPISYNLNAHFVERPWSALRASRGMPIHVNPFAIGLAFTVPLDLLFSCWVFFLVWKLQHVVGSMAGVNVPQYPFVSQQILGGYLGILVIALWIARKHLWAVLNAVVGTHPDVDDSAEPMRYRTAALGALLGIAFLIGFCYRSGMSAVFATVFFVLYFLILFAFTRMRAELGPPTHGLTQFGPFQIIVSIVGSHSIPAQTLIASAPHWTHTKGFQSQPMPAYLESFKLAERSHIDTRKLWKVCLLATIVSIIVTFWAFLDLSYKWGGPGAWRGNLAYNAIERLLRQPVGTDTTLLSATAFGLIFVMAGTALRLRFLWWPLHPLGYPLAGYYFFAHLWFPFFVSWLIKAPLLKYGGIRAYRKALPLFLGLILGDFVLGSMWGIMGLLTGEPTYTFKNW
jgi:hypothetical protein